MDDLSRKISELLSDPQTMEQIKGLTGLFNQGTGVSDVKPPISQPIAANTQESGLLGGMADPNMLGMMMKLAPLLQSFQGEDDSTRLLKALRPFMHEERSKRIDGAIRLLQIMKVLPILKNSGIDLLPK